MAATRADSIGFDVEIHFPRGLGSLARPEIRVEFLSDGRTIASGVVPAPPSFLGRDLRVRGPKEPFDGLRLELLRPAWLSPAPDSAAVHEITLLND